MVKSKACKNCKTIIKTGSKCPKCGSEQLTETIKGKIIILNPEKSEIAKKTDFKEKGLYAIKTK